MEPCFSMLEIPLGMKKLKKTLPEVGGYSVQFSQQDIEDCEVIDTFEMSLLKHSKLLLRLFGRLLLLDLKSGLILEQKCTQDWVFSTEIDKGPVASQLQAVSQLRAFLPVEKITIRQGRGGLLDDEGKTRARFDHFLLSLTERSLTVCRTSSLRGYNRAFTDLNETLEKLGAISSIKTETVLKGLGVDYQIYKAKPVVSLDDHGPAQKTAVAIIRAHIELARRNEKGVVDDFDTEFLHDYRVGLRKVRSVLSLFKSVFDSAENEQLKVEFSDIMKRTNRLRDLDVYLLEKSKYFNLIPLPSHEGLYLLFEYFRKERAKEYKAVRKVVLSKKYDRRIGKLEKLFANDENLAIGPSGMEPSLDFGCRLILKRYKQVCKIAKKIDDSSPDEIVHQLRISCKKLRYLMEFFTPLFPGRNIKELIKALKRLQDNLGRFNDYSVQQSFLREVLRETLPEFKKDKIIVTESIGALTAMLYRLQGQERDLVMENFKLFDSLETQLSFRELFEIKGARK